MGFDRLVKAVDEWAGSTSQGASGKRPTPVMVFGQIGPGEWRPRHMEWMRFMDPPEFRSRCEAAEVIVGHAGMGTIITALELGKRVLVMPRRGDLLETRNDHQLATARRFQGVGGVRVAWDESEVGPRLDEILAGLHAVAATGGAAGRAAGDEGGGERLGAYASPRLIGALRAFIAGRPVEHERRRERKSSESQVAGSIAT
jgi:UDP-N-acetylglucosamine transferase subunit ALG13